MLTNKPVKSGLLEEKPSRFAAPINKDQLVIAEEVFVPSNTNRSNKWAKRLFSKSMGERNRQCSQDVGRLDILETGTNNKTKRMDFKISC